MPASFPVRFASLLDLARLPWFARSDEERLVLRDRSVGPIADLHTHLALSYGRPPSVDLGRLHPETQHYFPTCCALDLDVYANQNMTREHVRALTRDLTWRSLGPRGMRATHTVPNLLREMDETGIRAALLLPIDYSVHPFASDAERRLDGQLARGARGVKVHPAVQMVRPDARRARRLYGLCGEREMIVFWHCGPAGIEPRLGRHLNQVKWYEAPIAEHPRTTFVLGHAGARQFEQALALQRRYPNVWLETSSQSLSNVRRMVAEGDTTRIVHGSDWPFYHPAISVAKVLIATEGRPDVRHRMLWANGARLLGIE
jgi:hypothetical protein